MVVMHHGRVMESGMADELFAQPRHPYLKALVGAVPRIGMPRDERLKPLRDIPVSVPATARPPAATQTVLLRAEGLQKRFAGRKAGLWPGSKSEPAPLAVNDVSFEIRRGECLGLVGESGSGKTTVTRILARSIEADAGSIRMAGPDGNDIDVLALEGEALRQWRRRIQFVFQNPYSALNPRTVSYTHLTLPTNREV